MAGEAEKTTCERHPGEEIASHCSQCGKGICRQCVESFGYFCGPDCLSVARMASSHEDKKAVDDTRKMMAKAFKILAIVGVLVVLAVVGIGGFLAWKFFLSPAGKIAWQWKHDGSIENTEVIGSQDGKVYVRTPEGISILDLEKGISLGDFNNPDVANVNRLEITGDGFVGVGAAQVVCFDTNGKTKATFELKGWGSQVMLSPDYSYACCFTNIPPPGAKLEIDEEKELEGLYPDSDEAHAKLKKLWDARAKAMDESRRFMSCIDVKAGKELWKKELPRDIGASRKVFIGGLLLVTYSRSGRDEAPENVLVAYDAQTGERKWRRLVDSEWGSGVMRIKDGLIVMEPGRLVVMGPDAKVRWALEYSDDDEPSFFVKENLLFCEVIGGTRIFDLATGKLKWKTNLEMSEGGVFLTPDSVIIQGELTKKTKIDLSQMPGFNQDEETVKQFGLDKTERDESVPILICMDRQTGKVKWKHDYVVGDVFCDGKRVVLFMDTARTSRLSMLKDSSESVVRQYDPESGTKLYEKVHKIGIGGPVLAGEYLVGVEFDTDEAAAKNKFSIAEAAGGGNPEAIKSQGIVAVRLK